MPRRPLPLGELNREPLVSTLIPNFNKARFVGDAIESALRQTYDRVQVIVCDDGSTDDSLAEIERYSEKDERVLVVEKPNAGQASALNAAFDKAEGDVICLLDSDDLFLPHKVESVVKHLVGGAAGLVIHPVETTDGAGRPLQRLPLFGRLRGGWLAAELAARGGRWRSVPP